VDGTSSDKQSKDLDKCLFKSNMYEINMFAKRIIIVNVLREMTSKILLLSVYELFIITH
jgi:hypothetical protein